MSVAGGIALVTGATRGIGEATALLMGSRGAHVLVSGRDAESGHRVVDAVRAAGGRADFLAASLDDAASAARLAAEACTVAGRVDILINNAAVGAFGPTSSIKEADFDACFALNVKAPFYLVGALRAADGPARPWGDRERVDDGGLIRDGRLSRIRREQGSTESVDEVLGG